jgi:diguanylate cyclase (GGDEF)-like protein
LQQQFFIILIGKMIQTFCVSLFIIFIFYELIAKHLNQMARYAKNLTLDKLNEPLILNKTDNSDELDQVSSAINAMCVSLENGKRQLQEGEKNRIRLAQSEKEKEIAERLSITDELTQLYNRRYFNNEFPKEIHRAARSKQIISFLMFDVDYFKFYNDNYGHQKGDDVLREIGQIVKAHCQRAGDIPIRLGGEEFGVIFSSISNQQAFEFADRIRMAIYNANIEHNFSQVCHYVTASFGLVTLAGTLSSNDNELYRQADDALYQAKEGGRNQVVQVCV